MSSETFKLDKMSESENDDEKAKILVIRHLKDINDLNNGRDSSLEPNQENVAEQIANDIISDFSKTNNKIIFLSVSDKKRARETSEMIKTMIEQKAGYKVVINPNGDLADLDHGEYTLPENYAVNDFYQPFEDAWAIFTQETFEKRNIDYKFGDNKNGEYKSIEAVWTRCGESYREIFLRLIKLISKFANDKDRFAESKVKMYVVTHSLPFAIFRSLYGLSQEIESGSINIKTGNLIFECWRYYNSGKLKRSDYGQIGEFPLDILQNQKLLDLIDKEINFLKKNEK